MVVKHKGNQEYEGLAADTKPVPADTAVNATFRETDTGNEYHNDGSAWILIRSGNITTAFTWIVYKQVQHYTKQSQASRASHHIQEPTSRPMYGIISRQIHQLRQEFIS